MTDLEERCWAGTLWRYVGETRTPKCYRCLHRQKCSVWTKKGGLKQPKEDPGMDDDWYLEYPY